MNQTPPRNAHPCPKGRAGTFLIEKGAVGKIEIKCNAGKDFESFGFYFECVKLRFFFVLHADPPARLAVSKPAALSSAPTQTTPIWPRSISSTKARCTRATLQSRWRPVSTWLLLAPTDPEKSAELLVRI